MAGDEQNSYKQKQQQRRERLLRRAARAEQEATTARHKADSLSQVMNGQPILIGHHSERRHRRDIDRMQHNVSKSVAAHKRAQELRRQSEAIGSGGISSDDPDAIAKLREELAALNTHHALMLATNTCVRKNDLDGLRELGFSQEGIEDLFIPDFMGRVGYPDYAIKNNKANIRRIEKRIAELEERESLQNQFQEITGEGWRIYAEENRVCIWFETKPTPSMRSRLKQHGFKWSPSRGAWVRFLNNGGIAAARYVMIHEG